MVNHGILLLAAVLVSTYLGLIGSMANTGTLFVLSGVLLLGLGGFLERRRRTLLHLIRLNPLSHPAP
jgi:UDP-N-acetylmuramyl pentapeptide phosphotransferase/UDP-N-acetylglucosamine-1-phosphate transferase